MSRPQFKPIREHVAELATFAASHTPEETRQEIDRLPPGVRRKVLDAASHGAFSWAERHGKATTTGGQRP
jgi:hypothetical protein